jgi:hypothetical protein
VLFHVDNFAGTEDLYALGHKGIEKTCQFQGWPIELGSTQTPLKPASTGREAQ